MIHQTCYCDVKDDKIDNVIEHTKNWILTLQQKYPEPIHYEFFQEKENPNLVSYYIGFSDKTAEEEISSKQEPRQFGEKLYSMCKSNPVWKYHNVIASIRNSQKDSKYHLIGKYEVKPDMVDDVKKAVVNFVDEVKQNEPDIRVYEVWQQEDRPTKFVYLEEYSNEDAFESHKNASHTKRFVEYLLPKCLNPPEFTPVNLLGSKELNSN